jgi:hypothetical protein
MPTETRRQKQTVARVMHEFKTGDLQSGQGGKGGQGGQGGKVKSPRQAIAIALSEAGASNEQAPAEHESARGRTRNKEHSGTTTGALAESNAAGEPTFAQLVKKARVLGIPGRSRMTKDQLTRALRRH